MAPRDLGDFAGAWRLIRRIEDRRAGLSGHMEGQAVFAPDAAGLTCDEEGRMCYGAAAPMQARRRYLWRADEPGRIAVLYGDGRPFHAFALGATAEARHDCAPDLYRVAYDFTGWPEWRADWHVTGPRKDYTSRSVYSPS